MIVKHGYYLSVLIVASKCKLMLVDPCAGDDYNLFRESSYLLSIVHHG